jgi:hypothetical protein
MKFQIKIHKLVEIPLKTLNFEKGIIISFKILFCYVTKCLFKNDRLLDKYSII